MKHKKEAFESKRRDSSTGRTSQELENLTQWTNINEKKILPINEMLNESEDLLNVIKSLKYIKLTENNSICINDKRWQQNFTHNT